MHAATEAANEALVGPRRLWVLGGAGAAAHVTAALVCCATCSNDIVWGDAVPGSMPSGVWLLLGKGAAGFARWSLVLVRMALSCLQERWTCQGES